MGVLSFQIVEFYVQNGSLHFVEAAIKSAINVMVTAVAAIV